ncbi:putative periplasmic protein [Salmonella enterica subsp. enterica serovar Daytona]|uniref:Putative periplasmic protein n=1 Tax=Salmonella enterica subsp. enterica serovar Daytona TaxID=1962639 RepID=A0A447JEN4_SALET|nr:putative periplasmic protein [Salmonella enterica subsp. enterica serovar Daytona]
MTLSRSAGARTDAVLRIDRGGLAPPDAKEAAIAPRLLLDGKPLSFNSPHWRVSPWHLMTGDPATITAFLQTIQDAQAITLKKRRSDAFAGGIKSGITVYRRATKTCGQRNRLD